MSADRIKEFLDLDDDWVVARFETEGPADRDLAVIKSRRYDLLEELAKLPARVHFVALTQRAGVLLFTRLLELRYFPPHTPRNRDYAFHLVRWEGLSWCVVSIPASLRRFVDRVCERTGLRVADGIPTVLDRGPKGVSPKFFPLSKPNVWSLENDHRKPQLSDDDEKRLIRELEAEFERVN